MFWPPSAPGTVQGMDIFSLELIKRLFEENKESLEFRSPFDHRRSKSSNSIIANQESTPEKKNEKVTRRSSDTLICSEKQHPTGQSPSKRFIRKYLSPVVCGLPSIDRHNFINGSLLSLRSYDSGSIISVSDETYPQLFDFGSHELMEEMTLMDKELLVRISWGELSVLGWMSPDKHIIAPNIMKMVEFFNRVVMMVTTSILAEENVYRRAKVVQKAIKLALKFKYQKNFNLLKAVLGGLQCTPIFRLKQTWKQVPSRYRRVFRELSELMSEESNFYNYRVELMESMNNPPCIPFLGNFLTTVAHVHAYVTVQSKYNKEKNESDEDESDESGCTSPSPAVSPRDDIANENVGEGSLSKQVDPCMRSSTSKIHTASHMRTDSDDSGVVLNVHRLSRSSDDLETSPREENLSSPDEDGRSRYDDEIFHKKHSEGEQPNCACSPSVILNDCPIHSSSLNNNKNTAKVSQKPRLSLSDANERSLNRVLVNQTRHRRSVSEIVTSSSSARHHRSVSVSDAGFRNAIDIASVINNRPVARKEQNELYNCEVQFWKYQIAAVQYRIIPKSYIRRYLMNCPYNTEEENYKLSLKREPRINLDTKL